ncbi:hypothetical protein BDN70DRAFT_835427 [Pholiota conissans]|uniref:Uncharacterized protein n=1 Tax=Pholiota conissans TaxID=109636 RepID=A0A9P5Z263_9AGAR|nr:hypothetical protein BDN70DRAFT_835427 [Pholiota conissans]
MAPWSPEIMESFQSIKPELESDFTPAAYNKLLNTLFPVNSPYAVFPQVHRHDGSSISSRATFTVYYKNTPVFLLDLFPYPNLARVSARETADDHIRMHVRDLLPYCHLSTLYALSAFGTRLAFYASTPGSAILPTRAGATDGTIVDEAPADWWDCDILEDDGAIRLKEVVNKIRNQCENHHES